MQQAGKGKPTCTAARPPLPDLFLDPLIMTVIITGSGARARPNAGALDRLR
jgi:hypothetical protein